MRSTMIFRITIVCLTAFSATIFSNASADAQPPQTMNTLRASDIIVTSPWVDIRAFGAKGDGITDNTSAIQAAIDSITRGVVLIPEGNFKFTDTITISKHRVNILGLGRQTSILTFAPGSEKTAFLFRKWDEQPIVQNSIRNLAINGLGPGKKCAIQCVNQEELTIEDVAILHWTDNSHGSIGIRSRGKHLLRLNRISLNADIPIKLEKNPQIYIDADHYHFSDTYLIAHPTQPCILIDSGMNIFNFTIDGQNAWCVGKSGIYWNDTTSNMASYNVSISNVRIEQEIDSAAYLFHISHNHRLYNLKIDNIYGGLTSKGFYFRKIDNPLIMNSLYINPSGNQALNIDGTVNQLALLNNFWQQGTTATLTNQRILFSLPMHTLGAIPSTAFYGSTADADLKIVSQSSWSGPVTTLENNQTAKICSHTVNGLLFISEDDNASSIYMLKGTSHAAVEISDPDSVYTPRKDAVGSNIYREGTNYVLQNRRGKTIKYRWFIIGADGF